MKGFMNFVREQGVVGLAVGLVLGGAVAKFVSAIVEDIVQPVLGMLLGGAKGLETLVIPLFGDNTIKLGDLILRGIDFAAIAAVVYYVVMGLGLNKLDKKKEA